MQLDTGKAYLLLGTNLGDRKLNLEKSIAQIKLSIGDVFAISSIYETEPWGNTNQPGFLNQAVGVSTKLSPQELIKELLSIEQDLGRVRLEKWGQRLIDIDIIFYGDKIVDEQDLKLPHPLMQDRKFVLVPLNEIAGEIIHPLFKQKISSILANLSDDLLVSKFTE
jgi:2-amino-4-hydroxy-6-hydroxymethyldihydropteridine diphosphokinase